MAIRPMPVPKQIAPVKSYEEDDEPEPRPISRTKRPEITKSPVKQPDPPQKIARPISSWDTRSSRADDSSSQSSTSSRLDRWQIQAKLEDSIAEPVYSGRSAKPIANPPPAVSSEKRKQDRLDGPKPELGYYARNGAKASEYKAEIGYSGPGKQLHASVVSKLEDKLGATESASSRGQDQNARNQNCCDGDRVLCQFCGRKFQPDAAKRHVPVCERINHGKGRKITE
jgi:hypothetical protein